MIETALVIATILMFWFGWRSIETENAYTTAPAETEARRSPLLVLVKIASGCLMAALVLGVAGVLWGVWSLIHLIAS